MPGPVPDPDFVRQVLVKGDTWQLDVEFPNTDLSGWEWSCDWKAAFDAEDVFAEATVDTSQAEDGLISFTVDSATTATIDPPTSYYWRVRRVIDPDPVESVVAGRVDVDW